MDKKKIYLFLRNMKSLRKNFFFFLFLFYCLYQSRCCGYLFELHRRVDAIQMDTHNIYLYKEVDKKYTGCTLQATELLDYVLIGECAVIR